MADAIPHPRTVAWHNLPAEEVFDLLKSSAGGLSHEEARERQSIYGANRFLALPKERLHRRFLQSFNTLTFYAFMAAAAWLYASGRVRDAAIVAVAMGLLTLHRLSQSSRARAMLGALLCREPFQAQVMRERRWLSVPVEELVLGDVVQLREGNRVPAELRILAAQGLMVEEEEEGGARVVREKAAGTLHLATQLPERNNLAGTGSLVVAGEGLGIVVAAGADAGLFRKSPPREARMFLSRLARQCKHVTVQLGGCAVVLALALMGYAIAVEHVALQTAGLIALGLAAVAVPAGLVVMVQATQAAALQRVAAAGVHVRKLKILENLASVTVLLADKTGILTQGQPGVEAVVTAGAHFQVKGGSLSPLGSFHLGEEEINIGNYPALFELSVAAVLSSDARLRLLHGEWQLEGSPTEGALLAMAMKAGQDKEVMHEYLTRAATVPFERSRGWMATVHMESGGSGFVYLKGQPEAVLNYCRAQGCSAVPQPLDKAYWQQAVERLTRAGMSVIALAVRPARYDDVELQANAMSGDFILLGLVGLNDPLCDKAVEGAAACRAAGIKLKMVTGDHPVAAAAIAARLGLPAPETVLTGEEIDKLDDITLGDRAKEVQVFARCMPAHKQRLVEVLRAGRQVVAVTGVHNADAPALAKSHAGVVVAGEATDIAKDAAAVILRENCFRQFLQAVAVSRAMHVRIRELLCFMLATGGGLALTLVMGLFFQASLPLTTVQLAWVVVLLAVALEPALALSPPRGSIYAARPLPPKAPLLDRAMLAHAVVVALALAAACGGVFMWLLTGGANVETARTAGAFAFVAGAALALPGFADAQKSRHGVFFLLLSIGLAFGMQLLFSLLPSMQEWFGTARLPWETWGMLVGVAFALALVSESTGRIARSAGAPRASAA